MACVKFIIFARIIIERTGFYFFTPLKHAKIRNKFALGGNQKKQRETKERHMLTTKILANILVLLTTFGGSAFAAPSIRQIGNIGTSSNSSVKPLPVASNQARAATPMMQKMSSSVVNTAKSATTSATPLYSTEQNRLVVKPLSGGKTNSINLKPTNNVSNTLLLHLDQEVQGIHDTMATLATQGQVNSAVNTAKSEMQDAIDTATEKMVTFGEGGNLNEKIANTATIASIQSELGDKMTEEDVEGIVSDATVGMITSGQSFNNELASTSLYNTVNNETTGLVAKTNALNNVINNESTGLVAKTQALDNTINNTSTGLVAKTQALDNTINNTSTGLLAKTAALDETINNTSTGLVAKTAAIESAFDKDTNGTIKNVKPDFVPSGIPMEKVSGLTGDTGLVAKTNALSDTINNESTGLVAKTNALSNTINNETTGLIAKTNALTTKTSTLEDKFNKDPESGQITTLKETIIPTEIARKNYINTTLDNMEFSVNSDTQKVVYKVTDQAGWKDLTDVSTFGGTQGKSAYQSWLDQGNTGNEGAFIASLKGEDGKTPDFTVEDGVLKYKTDKNDSNETFKTLATVKGKSAYESWKDDGNTGSESEFVASLQGSTCGVTKQEDTETVSGVRQTTVTFINSCTNQAIGNSIVVKDGVDGADAEISEEDITRLKLVTVNEDGVIDAVKIPALNYQAPINDLETIRGNASTGAGLSGAVSTLQGKFDTNGNLKTDNLVLPDTVITTTTPKYQALMNNVNSSGQITSTAALPAAVVTSGTDGNIGTVLAANNVVTGGRTGNFATLLDNSSLASTVSDLENSVSDNGDLVDSLIDALVQGNYITRTGNSISIKTIAVEK